MSFFQRLRNALSRFMYGRNGADQLSLCIIWVAILLDVISMLTKNTAVSGVVGMITTVLVLWALFRVFSRNLEKRRRTPPFCRRSGGPSSAGSTADGSSGWTRSTSTSPAPTARPCAACR